MSNIAIKVENLSKRYLINHNQQSDDNFREMLVNKAKHLNPLRKNKTRANSLTEEFWALKDINFEINQGDRVGIIGRNGAGKSTLLKVLSRITEPTKGKIHINGRIASLLEVGTGFHPELTGRENIYLNGAILGMSRAEIKAKFDEIVSFAEVEKFLDTPVKRYSSGMYVRLAFAVAAHLEPEILVVDEVLAVGDVEFQKKCLGKMNDVSKDGRTILFVSHNMNAIEQLCNKGMLLKSGSIYNFDNEVTKVIHKYFESGATSTSSWTNKGNEFENEYFKPLSLKILDKNLHESKMPIASNEDHYVQIQAKIDTLNSALTIGYCIYTEDGQQLYWSYQTDTSQDKWPLLRKGNNNLLCKIPTRLLREGNYRIEIIGGLHFIKWLFEPGNNNPEITIEVRGGVSDSPYYLHSRPTLISPVLEWKNIDV